MIDTITNEVYEKAYGDENNIRVMLKATKRFSRQLSSDDLTEQMQLALLRCLRDHKPDKGKKFTTSLYEHTFWACLNAVRDKNRSNKRRMLSLEDLPDLPAPSHPRQDEIDCIYECLTRLKAKDRLIISQYYLENMTLSEIGRCNGYTRQAASNNLKDAIRRLKTICYAG